MYCTACGCLIKNDFKFCANCGSLAAPLASREDATEITPVSTISPPVSPADESKIDYFPAAEDLFPKSETLTEFTSEESIEADEKSELLPETAENLYSTWNPPIAASYTEPNNNPVVTPLPVTPLPMDYYSRNAQVTPKPPQQAEKYFFGKGALTVCLSIIGILSVAVGVFAGLYFGG